MRLFVKALREACVPMFVVFCKNQNKLTSWQNAVAATPLFSAALS